MDTLFFDSRLRPCGKETEGVMSSMQRLEDSMDTLTVTALRVKAERDELLAALKTIFGYIEDGTLVRNISQDNLSDWQLRMMRFVNALSKAKVAIDKAEGN